MNRTIARINLIDLINQTDEKLSFVDQHYIYRAVNQAYLKSFNKQENEIVGKYIWEIIGKNSFEKIAKPYLDRALGGEEVKYESWFNFADGTRAYILVRYHPSRDSAGKIRGVIVTATDRTEHKKLEEERAFYEQLMLEQSKMAQLGDMIAMISHQWRGPLHTLSTYLLRLKYENNSPNGDEIIDRCESMIEQLSDTINDLYQFFDPKDKDHQITLLASAEHAISLLQHRIRSEKIEIYNTISPECTFRSHNGQLLHLFVVFIENGIDALKRCDQSPKKIELTAHCNEANVVIDICDNGDGIAHEMAEEIFNPRVSTKESDGHGYGLYFARKIITSHLGGNILLIDEPKGAHFRITLPKN